MNGKKILDYLRGYISVIVWCIPFSWKASRLYTIIRIIGTISIPLLTIMSTYLSKYIIDILAGSWNTNSPVNALVFILLITLCVTLLRKSIQLVVQYCQGMHNEVINGKIALMIMDRSLSADLEYYDNPDFNDKLTSANQDSQAIANILWNVISAMSAVVSLISVFIVICQANILFGIAIIASAIPSSILTAKFTRSLYQLSLDQINDQRKMNYTQSIASNRQYAQDVRLFRIGGWLKQKYTKTWRNLLKERRRLNRKTVIVTGLLEFLPEIVIVLISISIGLNILNGHATLGDYSLYTGLIAQLWTAVYTASSTAMEIYGNRLKIDNIKTLEHFKNKIVDDGNLKLVEIKSISFDEVRFTYPGAEHPALYDISFDLHKDEKVALVGLNGSGKTTLIKLLLRMYEPDHGNIQINGIDIKQYEINELRLNFSVYFQDMLNYGFTLRENFIITDTNQEASNSQIETALAKANFLDILDYSTKRHDVSVMRFFDPQGIELSGGQYQKLALARVFFRKNTALILDEPSSNLDPMAEKIIFDSLAKMTDDKMTIFTSHRLSNVSLADRIIVMEQGRIVEDGTHIDLLKNNKRYAELFRINQEKYNMKYSIA